MVKSCQRVSASVTFWVLGIALLFQGCATPIEIKNASKAQMQLIDSLDSAVANLQAALDQFHRDKEVRIREEGRMKIARQAIDVAISNDKVTVTADQLYDAYKKKIQPWVDYAFISSDIADRMDNLQKRINKTSDSVLKMALTQDLEDLRLLQTVLAKKPKDVKELEAIIQDDLNNEENTRIQNQDMLKILRAQVALMKAMHGKVDAWLAIDVTVTQQQADALKDAFSSAI